MSIHTWNRHRGDAPAGWQPIGLPEAPASAPAAFVRRPAITPALRRSIRQMAAPAAALTASVAIVTMTAFTPSAQAATASATLLSDDSPSDQPTTISAPNDTTRASNPRTPQTAEPISTPATPSTALPQTSTPQAADPQVKADPKGILPALPNADNALPNLDGDTTKNTTTPGQSSAAGGASYGVPSTQVTSTSVRQGDTDVYLADPSSRTFNGSDGGWTGYQEYSPWCWSRGVSCVNWNFKHQTTGGPDGAGDGYLQVNGTSLGVAPCVPNTGVGRWVSPLFTYNTSNAKGWKMDFDFKTTALVAGDGHATFSIQILDDQGRVVTTAHGPHAVMPTNHWDHFSNGFDGSKLVYGKNYRVSIMVDVVHAETALTWGNLDFDNIQMSAVPGVVDGNGPKGDGTDPSTKSDALTPYELCRPTEKGAADALTELATGDHQDFCPVSNAAGQAAAPLLDIADKAMKDPSVSNLLDKGSGAFAVLNLQTADFVGYAIGRDAMPSTDPRDLVAYVKDGGIGEAGNYALVFVTDTASLAPSVAKNPVGAATNIATGQVQNATELLSDPGRLTRIPLDWQVGNAKWMLETVANPLISKDQRDTAIGGTVWADDDKDGALDPTERGVPGVKVDLKDRNGNDYGTAVTGQDGRYRFSHLTPRTDPSDYYITFEPDSLPGQSTFTTEHAPGTVHGTTSHADPTTGETDRIRINRYQEDLNWNAGIVNVPADHLGNTPGQDAPGEPADQGGPTAALSGLLGSVTTPGGDQPSPLGGVLGGGIPGLPGTSSPSGDQPSGSDPLGGVLGGSLPGLPGTSTPSGDQPSGDQPSGDQPSGDQPGSDNPSSDQPSGSDPLGGVLGGSLPGLPGTSSPSGDQPSGSDPLGGVLGGSLPGLPGTSSPSGDQPSGDQPSGDQPSGDQPSGSDPLGGVLGGSLPGLPGTSTPSGDQPSGDQPSGDQPGSDQPGSDQPGSDQPGSDQPSSDPLSTVTKTLSTLLSKVPGTSPSGDSGSDPLGGVLGGSLPLPGSDSPSSDQPSSDQPSSDQPSSDQPSSDQPSGDQPSGSQPSGDQPGSQQPSGSQPTGDQPSSQQPADGPTNPAPQGDQPTQSGQPSSQQDTLSFQVGKPSVNGTAANKAPGATVTPGSEITVSVPVTNNGSTPITDVKAQVPGDDGLTDMQCTDTAIEPGQTVTCAIKVPAQDGNVKMGINIIGTSDDGQQMTKLCRIYYHAQQQAPQVGFTGKASLNGQSIQAAGQSPLSSTQPSSLSFQVVNKGNAPITSLSGTSPAGNVTCDSQSLAPGQTTNCTVTFTPKGGSNAMNVQMTGQDAAGHTSSSSFGFTYTANTGSPLSGGVAPSN